MFIIRLHLLHLWGLSSKEIRKIFFFPENVIGSALQWNQLLLRYNTLFSQLNIYSKLQAGIALLVEDFKSGVSKVYPQVGLAISGDAETRRFYIRYQLAGLSFFEEANPLQLSHEAALGVAPYIADFGALHTWIMVQADYSHTSNQLDITPLIRMFYDIFLWEVGINFRGKLLFNWIIRL